MSSDDLTATFTLPEGNVTNVEIAAYDADRGIIKDKCAVAVYNGVAAYAADGENVKIANTTGEDLDVLVIIASYDENGVLTSVNKRKRKLL